MCAVWFTSLCLCLLMFVEFGEDCVWTCRGMPLTGVHTHVSYQNISLSGMSSQQKKVLPRSPRCPPTEKKCVFPSSWSLRKGGNTLHDKWKGQLHPFSIESWFWLFNDGILIIVVLKNPHIILGTSMFPSDLLRGDCILFHGSTALLHLP